MNVTIRPEEPADYLLVEELNRHAFGGAGEAQLISRLRGSGPGVLSLVAEVDGNIVGHIMFTPVKFATGSEGLSATALGPMAVDPGMQRHGIGSRLVKEGLSECRRSGEKIVFVLGHTDYYPRFGFKPAASGEFRYKSKEFDPHFFFLELEEGASKGLSGMVLYHEEFDRF